MSKIKPSKAFFRTQVVPVEEKAPFIIGDLKRFVGSEILIEVEQYITKSSLIVSVNSAMQEQQNAGQFSFKNIRVGYVWALGAVYDSDDAMFKSIRQDLQVGARVEFAEHVDLEITKKVPRGPKGIADNNAKTDYVDNPDCRYRGVHGKAHEDNSIFENFLKKKNKELDIAYVAPLTIIGDLSEIVILRDNAYSKQIKEYFKKK